MYGCTVLLLRLSGSTSCGRLSTDFKVYQAVRLLVNLQEDSWVGMSPSPSLLTLALRLPPSC